MMESIKALAEFVAYVLVGLMGVGMVLTRLGILSFGKKQKEGCMDLDCKEKVTIMGERVENHERILDTLVEVGQQNARTLAYIRGRIETAKIIKLDE